MTFLAVMVWVLGYIITCGVCIGLGREPFPWMFVAFLWPAALPLVGVYWLARRPAARRARIDEDCGEVMRMIAEHDHDLAQREE